MIALSDFLSPVTLGALRSIDAEELAQVDAIDLLIKVAELEVAIHHLSAALSAACFAAHVRHLCCHVTTSLGSIFWLLVRNEGGLTCLL